MKIHSPSLDHPPSYVSVGQRGTGGALPMYRRSIEAALLFGLAVAAAGTVSAQQHQLAPDQPSIMERRRAIRRRSRRRQPAASVAHAPPGSGARLSTIPISMPEDELAPSQCASRCRRRSRRRPAAKNACGRLRASPTPQRRTGRRRRAGAGDAKPDVVGTCNGVFASDSSHAKLAMAYRSRNVAFTQVDAAAGAQGDGQRPVSPRSRSGVWKCGGRNRRAAPTPISS